jgi:hypothetical protein
MFFSGAVDADLRLLVHAALPPFRPHLPPPPLCASGDLDSLLEAYDRERRAVPSPVTMWQWGWTKSSETWNGRLAMLAITAILALELVTGQSLLKHLLDLEG